jgi:hypothetical protein
LTNKPLIKEARIRTYRYKDFPKYIAEMIDTYPIYSFSSTLNDNNPIVQKRKSKIYMNKESFNKFYNYNKFVFLEIPSQVNQTDQPTKKYYHLNEYSKQILIPNLLDEKFPTYFDFNQVSKEAMIRFFMKNAIPMNEYSSIQIRSGIKRLKDIIKYSKPNEIFEEKIPDPINDRNIPQPKKRGAPSREYLNTH